MADVTKAVELRNRNDDELRSRLSDLKKEQFNLRFQRATGQLEGTARFKMIRREAARIMTVLNERARTAAAG